MNKEEINYVLESLRFKTSIYRDKKKRNLPFNDDEYYSNILIEYIEELHNKIDKAIEITHKILMNNADNRMICTKEEEEYFDWLDKEMLEQEKILKGDVDE